MWQIYLRSKYSLYYNYNKKRIIWSHNREELEKFVEDMLKMPGK